MEDEQVGPFGVKKELTLFENTKDNLVRLYSEINALLIGVANEPSNLTLRRKVEYTKQQFYQWIECALSNCVMTLLEEEGTREDKESGCFLSTRIVLEDQDPIRLRAGRDADSLFKEMMGYIQFLLKVGDATDAKQAKRITIRAVNQQGLVDVFNKSDVERHVERLRYLILSRIDTLNVPLIDDRLAKQLGFSQQDYQSVVKQSIIPYTTLVRYLKETLHPQVLLSGPERAAQLLKGSAEKINLEDVRLFFWFLERQNKDGTPYSSLLFLHKQELWQRGVYTPRLATSETVELLALAKQLTQKSGITALRTELLSLDKPYKESSLYALFIIKRINERLESESIDIDWVGEMKWIVKSATASNLANMLETLIYQLRRYILELSLTREEKEEPLCLMPAKESIVTVSLSSNISDVAKLSMSSQLIDDNPIVDMLNMMPKEPTCYVYDPTYWGNMIENERRDNPPFRKSKVFDKPEIRKVLMPINQDNTHWALGIIDLNKRQVFYYSSIAKDAYYRQTFRDFMSRFLQVQTPGVEYKFSRVKGPLQAYGCLDCALFMLNKISRQCSPLTQEIVYTRESIIATLLKRIVKRAKSPDWLNLVVLDVHSRFVTLPATWKNIYEDSALLADYRNKYLVLLRSVLEESGLYTREAVLKLIEALKTISVYEKLSSITRLFENLALGTSKRKRREILLYTGGESEQSKKTRKCLLYNPETQKKVDTLIDQLIYLKQNQPKGKIGLDEDQSSFIYDYLVLPLVSQKLASFQMLDDVVDEIFLREEVDLRDRLLEVIQKYVKPDQTCKIVIQCLYCGELTSLSAPCCKKK